MAMAGRGGAQEGIPVDLDALKEAMDKAGVDQSGVAKIAGVSPQSVSGWFREGKGVSPKAFVRIVKGLPASADRLLGIVDASTSGSMSQSSGAEVIDTGGDTDWKELAKTLAQAQRDRDRTELLRVEKVDGPKAAAELVAREAEKIAREAELKAQENIARAMDNAGVPRTPSRHGVPDAGTSREEHAAGKEVV